MDQQKDNNSLTHWKYIKRIRKGNRYVYFYDTNAVKNDITSSVKKLANSLQKAATSKNTLLTSTVKKEKDAAEEKAKKEKEAAEEKARLAAEEAKKAKEAADKAAKEAEEKAKIAEEEAKKAKDIGKDTTTPAEKAASNTTQKTDKSKDTTTKITDDDEKDIASNLVKAMYEHQIISTSGASTQEKYDRLSEYIAAIDKYMTTEEYARKVREAGSDPLKTQRSKLMKLYNEYHNILSKEGWG